mgnify:FL=1
MMILTTTIHSKNISIIITAAGSSTRIGGGIKKEYLPYKNGTVISTCAKSFFKAIGPKYKIAHFVITTPPNAIEQSKKAVYSDSEIQSLEEQFNVKINFVEGSSTRQKSVFNGLNAISNSNTKENYVLIHDGARPFVSEQTILQTLEAAIQYGASVPGLTPTDTQKQINSEGFIEKHLERKSLVAVQTPQGFEFNKLYEAHKKSILENVEYTDDTEIWGKYCGAVKVIEGDSNNIKITY